MKKIITCALMFIFIACASTGRQEEHADGHGHQHGKFTKHLADSILLVAEKGLFSVEMSIPDKILKVGANTFELDIHEDRDRDVTGAKITVTPWMTEMGYGAFDVPVVKEKGNGTYIVENVVLVTGGHWEFRIHIKWGDTEDNVVFDFPYVGTAAKHECIKVNSPAGHNIVIGSKNPLKELRPEIIIEGGKTIKVFKMTVKDVGFEIFPGQPVMGWGFNGQIPGPTIRVNEGDRIRVVLENDSSGEHTLHIHGQVKPAVYKTHYMHTHSHKFQVVARDGSYVNEPQQIDTVGIGPGQRVDIILVADNPGIWPFHCHRLDHVTNEHVYPGGMLTYIKYEE